MHPEFPGYEILAELADNGETAVYKARDIQEDRLVALKTGHITDPILAQRMFREAQAMASVEHAAVVVVYAVGCQRERAFIAMEFIEGGNLADKLGTPWAPKDAAEFIEAAARGVQAVHERGIVHGNIEPTHFLLTNDGKPKLCGFGCARPICTRAPVGSVLGKAGYVAPEKLTDESGAVPTMDLFSLSVVLYEMLTGRPPFRESSALKTLQKLVSQPPISPSTLQPTIPPDLEAICLKCLEKKPQDRYATADALADDLRRFLEGLPSRPTSAAATATRKPWWKKLFR
jgi:serine/threonine protein kinase